MGFDTFMEGLRGRRLIDTLGAKVLFAGRFAFAQLWLYDRVKFNSGTSLFSVRPSHIRGEFTSCFF